MYNSEVIASSIYDPLRNEFFFAEKGKGAFLKQHGYDEAYGKNHWKDIGEKNFNTWGLHDDRLFFHAKQKILELHKNKQPFNFTMLTLNLHEPNGFSDRLCASKGYVLLGSTYISSPNISPAFTSVLWV